jgi:BirA family transcriptional regulator, biotin operon repressor / biotin---[acetyl-CoA-carboxylase] ligase
VSALGQPRVHLRQTDSTNDRARQLALAGAPHGTLVTAAEQTAGRGRQGRRWSAPAGSALLMSLVLRETPSAPLPLLAAVAVCDVAGPDALVKWPNDIVVRRPPQLGKLAGILVEGRPQQGWAVLGIGLNVAVRLPDLPSELRHTAATLDLGRDAIEPLLATLLTAIDRRLGESQAQTLDAWRARDALRGREIAWSGGHGRAEGIDEHGQLLVALPGGEQTALVAGEVHLESLTEKPQRASNSP